MYGVIYINDFPDEQNLNLVSLELFSTFEEAKKRTYEIADEFSEEYGIDDIEYATEESPVTIMFNGEITAYAYIQKISK